MFELKSSLFLPPISIFLFLRADRKRAHKKCNNEKCIFLFWIDRIKRSQKYVFKSHGFVSVPSTSPVLAYSRCCCMMQPSESEAASVLQAGNRFKEGVKEHERRGKRVVAEDWPQFKGSLFISWYYGQWSEGEYGIKVTHSMLFFSFFYLSSCHQTW